MAEFIDKNYRVTVTQDRIIIQNLHIKKIKRSCQLLPVNWLIIMAVAILGFSYFNNTHVKITCQRSTIDSLAQCEVEKQYLLKTHAITRNNLPTKELVIKSVKDPDNEDVGCDLLLIDSNNQKINPESVSTDNNCRLIGNKNFHQLANFIDNSPTNTADINRIGTQSFTYGFENFVTHIAIFGQFFTFFYIGWAIRVFGKATQAEIVTIDRTLQQVHIDNAVTKLFSRQIAFHQLVTAYAEEHTYKKKVMSNLILYQQGDRAHYILENPDKAQLHKLARLLDHWIKTAQPPNLMTFNKP